MGMVYCCLGASPKSSPKGKDLMEMVYSWLGASPKSSPEGKDLMGMVFLGLYLCVINNFVVR